jgi:GGDEF domain-containing protein
VEYVCDSGHDTLTGLPDADHFYAKLSDLCWQSARHEIPLCLIGIRLRNLATQVINAGDGKQANKEQFNMPQSNKEREASIATMGSAVLAVLRSGESVTRISEDGFWLLALAKPDQANRICQRIELAAIALGMEGAFEIKMLPKASDWNLAQWIEKMDLIYF